MILVYGSNLDGANLGGAARAAKLHFGAIDGIGEGITGHAYALPTVGHDFAPMPLAEVKIHVERFIHFAHGYPKVFKVTRVGCGIAGFKDSNIAPMFADAPFNCLFDEVWREFLPDRAQFWGSF